MRLLPRRPAGAELRIDPATPVRPTDTITVGVVLADAIDGVTAARVELGYDNHYNYRWAGKHSHAYLDENVLFFDMAGTDHGSHRDVTDWVAVLDAPLPLAGGRLEGGVHAVPLRLPSWAPGSSDTTVTWRVRLCVERSGRDVEAEQTFEVVVPPPTGAAAPVFVDGRLEGESSDIGIALERDWWRPGEPLRGTATIAARGVDLIGDVDLRLERLRESHPLVRTPGPGQIAERPILTAVEGLALPAGLAVAVPFELVVPADAPPSTETVHSSIHWFVRLRVRYTGQVGHVPDVVRRGFGVFTA